MREIKYEMSVAVKRVNILKGRKIVFKINTGRNNFISVIGRITQVYPSVFVISDDEGQTRTFSYNDVVMKSIRFFPLRDQDMSA